MTSSVQDAHVILKRVGTLAEHVTLTHLTDDVDAVSQGAGVIGYIRTVGQVFVALVGTRLDRAEECAQSQRWDKAAEQLLLQAGSSSEKGRNDDIRRLA